VDTKDIISEEIDCIKQSAQAKKLLGQFKNLLDTLPDPVFMKDEHLRWIYGNPVILDLYNIAPDDYIGKTEDQLLPPEFAPSCMASDERAKASGTIGVSEERACDPNGKIHYYEVFKVPSFDESTGSFQGLIGIGRDITERKEAEMALKESLDQQRILMEYDTLTGLFSPHHFKNFLQQYIYSEVLSSSYLMLVDIDKFHYFNDIVGHEKGDEFLQIFASALRTNFKDEVTLVRLGGNTFGLFFPSSQMLNAEKSIEIIYRILEQVNEKFGKTFVFKFTISIGVAHRFEDESINDLLNRADIALHKSKRKWGNSYHFYDHVHAEKIKENIYFHHQLVDILEHQENITLFYQPIIDLNHPTRKKCEALLRILDGAGNYSLNPNLISSAEKFGLIGEITRIVIQKAFQQQQIWKRSALEVELSINLAGDDLADEKLSYEIISLADYYGIDPKDIIFEVTENQALTLLEEASKWIKFLKSHGFRFALDDFGIGFASLENLKRLPFDYVKIDGSFIKDICHNPQDYAAVKAMSHMAEAFGLQCVAEYVENSVILAKVEELKIGYAQGWHFSKAVDAEMIERYWRDNKNETI